MSYFTFFKNLVAQPTKNNNLIYPEDLFSPGTEAYILFFIKDGVARAKEPKAKIALYMPPSIKVNYGSQWEDIQMTLAQYKSFGYDVSNALSAMAERNIGALMKTSAPQYLLDALDYVAGSNFGQEFQVIEGRTVNPHMALMFKGVQFRTFSFDFQMMARSREESVTIQKIINEFKKAMHPSVPKQEPTRWWNYPDNFDIVLRTPADTMFNISTSVLTDMTVEYGGSGIPVFFDETGAPVQINMNLQFKEMEVLTRERVEQGY